MKFKVRRIENKIDLSNKLQAINHEEQGSGFQIIVNRDGVRLSGDSTTMVTTGDLNSFAKELSAAWVHFNKTFKRKIALSPHITK